MKCAEVISMLDALLDNELATQTAAEMNDHMKECAPCATEWQEHLALRERMRTLGNKIATPPRLAVRIHKHVERNQPGAQALRVALAASILACLVSFGALKYFIQTYATSPGSAVAVKSPSSKLTLASLLANQSLLIAASDCTADPTCLSKQAGFPVCSLTLPGWKLASARLVKASSGTICMAQLSYVNPKNETLVCYQSSTGTIPIADLNHHTIGGRLFCCGKVCKMSVVYFPKDGHDFFLVSRLPEEDLMDLARQG